MNEAVLLMNGFNQYSDGWMAVSNKVREAIVHALTLVVAPGSLCKMVEAALDSDGWTQDYL